MNIIKFFILSSLSIIQVSALELDYLSASKMFANNNADALVAFYEKQKANGDLITAKALPNPQFTFGATGLNTSNIYDHSTSQQSYRLDWLMELGSKRAKRTEFAKINLASANSNYIDTMRNLFMLFTQQYYQTLKDKNYLDASQSTLVNYDKVLTVAKVKYEHGFLSENDFKKMQLARISYQSDTMQSDLAYKNDISNIAFLLGVSKDELTISEEKIEVTTPKPLKELQTQAFESRPDIDAAQKNKEQSKVGIEIEKAKTIPDVDIGVEADTVNGTPGTFLGVGFSLPILVFDRNEGEIEKAKLSLLQSDALYIKEKALIKSQVEQANEDLKEKNHLYQAYAKQYEDAKKLLYDIQKSFALKGISVLELLDAQNEFKEYEKNMLSSETDLLASEALLNLTIGSLPCEVKQH